MQPTRAAGKTPPPGGPDLEAINRDSGNCVIVWRSQPCCEGYVAVRRSQMNVPTPSFDDDPDCTEGPIDSPPPSPPSCHRGRIPTGVEETANGLCRLRFD